ncbi:hypothetical protein Tco_0014901 [Tanacetum coccineum]
MTVMVRLNSFARLISDAERQRVNQEKELKILQFRLNVCSGGSRFILIGNLCFKGLYKMLDKTGTKQVVHGDHRRGCSDSTLLRPHTNIEHIQLIDVEVQDAAVELDRLATISKDMELITRNRIRPFYYVVHTGLCEPAAGLMIVSDNVPTENASTYVMCYGHYIFNRSQHHFVSVPPSVPAGYGIEFAYVILSYNIVLKLGDPSPVLKQGQGETKSNPTTS